MTDCSYITDLNFAHKIKQFPFNKIRTVLILNKWLLAGNDFYS
jgi:hypothetical protein